ncbi:helix-turn-helix domain-containing protein [Paraburkholderia sacchari]|uniref:helix-turn-helix domain-containing protein n=1 Tax=Paraburkholderia sacchari TaxID=159450 RepID=UPI001BCFFE40|nr:helix-turn-helix domain-containing protein [Paraburkholderia sacchari]
MKTNKPKTSPPTWQLNEAAKLKALYDERASITQEEFGAQYEIGSQGMVWQYLNGHRPLNIAAATSFCQGLNIKIDEFSPRLVDEIRKAYAVVGEGAEAGPQKDAAPSSSHVSQSAQRLIDAVIHADAAGVSPAVLSAATSLISALVASNAGGQHSTPGKTRGARTSFEHKGDDQRGDALDESAPTFTRVRHKPARKAS